MSIVLGNKKIGPRIHQWSVRSGADCPGKTELCSKHCYAGKGHFMWKSVRDAHAKNRQQAARKKFVEEMNEEIRKKNVRVMRVHVDGDLYDVAYARNWFRIFQDNPQVVFFIYTRSWRVRSIKFWVDRMATLKHVSVWYSVDQETGRPPSRPARVRLAYMQVAEDDIPKFKVDLVFRIHALRGPVVKKVTCKGGSEALVCPTENGTDHGKRTTCTLCKFCYNQSLQHVRTTHPDHAPTSQDMRVAVEPERRVALQLV